MLSSNMHVLIADYIPGVLRMGKKHLTKHGYTVEIAENLTDTLAKIKAHPPDVLVCAMYLPEPDGNELLGRGSFELIKRLRADSRFANLMIILTTPGPGMGLIGGYDRDAYTSSVYQNSVEHEWRVDMVLMEPYNPAVLLQWVNRAIEVSRAI